MGLDMYLYGNKYESFGKEPLVDSFPVERTILKLAYWRKHSDLHGYLVKTFANGVDDCREFELYEDNLKQIIQDIKDDKLVPTTGFFFGASARPGDDGYEEQKQEDIDIFTRVLAWLEAGTTPGYITEGWRSVYYRYSW